MGDHNEQADRHRPDRGLVEARGECGVKLLLVICGAMIGVVGYGLLVLACIHAGWRKAVTDRQGKT